MAQTQFTDYIFKSRQIILEILKSQGYDTNDYDNFSIHEVHSMLQTKQLDILLLHPVSKKKTYIKYHLAKTLRLANIQEYIDDLFQLENILDEKDDLIIITKDEPNETLNRNLVDIWEQEKKYIRIIGIKRLQFNILNHQLVPLHTIIKDSDKIESILEKYNIKNPHEDLPDISRFSPVSLMIGIRPGEICEIDRDSKTAINSKFYRICI